MAGGERSEAGWARAPPLGHLGGPSERSPLRWGAPSEIPPWAQVAAWDLAVAGFAFMPILLGRPALAVWLGSS